MTQDSPSRRATALAEQFLSDDTLDLVPWHVLTLVEPDGLARFIRDQGALIAANGNGVAEEELRAAVIDRLLTYKPLTWWWLLFLAKQGDEDALRLLAAAIPWNPGAKPARAELARRAEEKATSWEAARRDLMPNALYAALEEIDAPQTYRYGRRWEKDASGNIASSRPWDRHIALFRWWLRRTVRNELEDMLAPEPAARMTGDDDLEAIRRELIEQALSAIVPRRYLDPLAVKLWVVHELGGNVAAESCRLGLSPGAGYKKIERLKRAIARFRFLHNNT